MIVLPGSATLGTEVSMGKRQDEIPFIRAGLDDLGFTVAEEGAGRIVYAPPKAGMVHPVLYPNGDLGFLQDDGSSKSAGPARAAYITHGERVLYESRVKFLRDLCKLVAESQVPGVARVSTFGGRGGLELKFYMDDGSTLSVAAADIRLVTPE
jgi:hypothetical protein